MQLSGATGAGQRQRLPARGLGSTVMLLLPVGSGGRRAVAAEASDRLAPDRQAATARPLSLHIWSGKKCLLNGRQRVWELVSLRTGHSGKETERQPCNADPAGMLTLERPLEGASTCEGKGRGAGPPAGADAGPLPVCGGLAPQKNE